MKRLASRLGILKIGHGLQMHYFPNTSIDPRHAPAQVPHPVPMNGCCTTRDGQRGEGRYFVAKTDERAI